MKISVIGCGYVGLVTGSCLAEAGHEVVCTDKDPVRIQTLQAGGIPIYEPYLDTILARVCRTGRLRFTGDGGEAVRFGDAIFICVGTPPLPNGDADLSAIDNVARMIATEVCSPKLVIEKSTVPAQTGMQLKHALAVYSRNPGVRFRVASNPEFLREGTAVLDFFHPDRIVVGAEDSATEQLFRVLYAPILERRFSCPVHAQGCPPAPKPPLLFTTINSAELIKHASNSFLALKISYANTLADLCDHLGANIEEVTHAMGLDPRIGSQFLSAGLGFGGFCLPKDIQAFIKLADRVGVDLSLLKEAERVNRQRIDQFLEMIRRSLWVVKGKEVALLGLAFKPNTDDIRLAPSIEIIARLLAEGARVRACDPEAIERTRTLYPNITFERDPYELLRGSDAALIITEWPEFRALDWGRIHGLMARPLILDGRNLLDPDVIRSLGFQYECFGRPDLTIASASVGSPIAAGNRPTGAAAANYF